MNKIEIEHIKPPAEYNRIRAEYREHIAQVKEHRRVLVGPYLNFLFENRETMLYQVQEMIRAEGHTSEESIRHEVDTYNQMVPGPHELKATLLIEIVDEMTRAVKLRELVGIEKEISMLIDQDYQVQAEFDMSQIDPGKVSSVQFISFPLGEQATGALLRTQSVEMLVTHSACSYRVALAPEQIKALQEDLRDSL
ncbi:MAG: DUF3501 family protein [bacterium]|nr:DUF3501 family protein [bacterium]